MKAKDLKADDIFVIPGQKFQPDPYGETCRQVREVETMKNGDVLVTTTYCGEAFRLPPDQTVDLVS